MLLSLLSSIQSELTLLAQANDTQQLQQWEFIEDIISIALYSNAKSTIARTMSIEHVFGNLYFECYNIIRRQNFAHLKQWALRLKHAIYTGEKNSNKIELTQKHFELFYYSATKDHLDVFI